MSYVDESRWSCPFPGCGVTVVVYASPDDIRCAVTACQQRHGNAHAADQKARTRRLIRALDRQDHKTPTMKRKTA